MHAQPDLDLFLMCHTHVPEMRSVAPGRWYINLGDWVYHQTYLVLEEGAAPQLLRWNSGSPVAWSG
jgi:UDP-2,3-diacylglucosamine pyrophosphatase LpxH